MVPDNSIRVGVTVSERKHLVPTRNLIDPTNQIDHRIEPSSFDGVWCRVMSGRVLSAAQGNIREKMADLHLDIQLKVGFELVKDYVLN